MSITTQVESNHIARFSTENITSIKIELRPNEKGVVSINGKIYELGLPYAGLLIELDLEKNPKEEIVPVRQHLLSEDSRRDDSKHKIIETIDLSTGKRSSEMSIRELLEELPKIHQKRSFHSEQTEMRIIVDGYESPKFKGFGLTNSYPYDQVLYDKLVTEGNNYSIVIYPKEDINFLSLDLKPEARKYRSIQIFETKHIFTLGLNTNNTFHLEFKDGEKKPYACRILIKEKDDADPLEEREVVLYYNRENNKIDRMETTLSLGYAVNLFKDAHPNLCKDYGEGVIIEAEGEMYNFPDPSKLAGRSEDFELRILTEILKRKDHNIIFCNKQLNQSEENSATVAKAFFGQRYTFNPLISSDLIKVEFTRQEGGEIIPSYIEFYDGELTDPEKWKLLVACKINQVKTTNKSKMFRLESETAESPWDARTLLEILKKKLQQKTEEQEKYTISLRDLDGNSTTETNYQLPITIASWGISTLLFRKLQEHGNFTVSGPQNNKQYLLFTPLRIKVGISTAFKNKVNQFEIVVKDGKNYVVRFFAQNRIQLFEGRDIQPATENQRTSFFWKRLIVDPKFLDFKEDVSQLFQPGTTITFSTKKDGKRSLPIRTVPSETKGSNDPIDRLFRLWRGSDPKTLLRLAEAYVANATRFPEYYVMGLVWKAILDSTLNITHPNKILAFGYPVSPLSKVAINNSNAFNETGKSQPEITDLVVHPEFINLSTAQKCLLTDKLKENKFLDPYDLIVCSSLQHLPDQEITVKKILDGVKVGNTVMFVLNRYVATDNFREMLIKRGFKIDRFNERPKALNEYQVNPRTQKAVSTASHYNYLIVATRERVVVPEEVDKVYTPLISPVLIRDDISLLSGLLRQMAEIKDDEQVIDDAREVFNLLGVLENVPNVELNRSELIKIVNGFSSVGFLRDQQILVSLENAQGLTELADELAVYLNKIGITDPNNVSLNAINSLEPVNIYYLMTYQIIKWVMPNSQTFKKL